MIRHRLRVALVGLTSPFRGGISHYTTLLCNALRQRHAVRFFSLRRQYPKLLFPGTTQLDESKHQLWADNEATIDSINPLSWIATARRIRRYRPDLVLISWWHPSLAPCFGTIAHLVSRASGCPVCFVCHNVLPHEPTPLDGLLTRFALSAGSAFITHSEPDAQALAHLRPGAPVTRHPHPVYTAFLPDATLSADAAKVELGLLGKKVVLFFGFVRAYKGLDVLLRAFDGLEPAAAYHLLLVGDFYQPKQVYAAGLEKLSARRQLTLVDRYVPNEEVGLFFTAADVLAAPYLSASQSGVVQVAYAFGKPVVASRVGGLPEVVIPGETGFLVPPGDPEALCAAIQECLRPENAEKLQAGIAGMRQACSWEGLVDAIEGLAERSRSGSAGAH